jgi:uncharacterized protein with GYD domain
MAKFVIFFSYTPESWAAMIKSGSNRAAAARIAIESVGGSLLAFYWMVGLQDGMAIIEAPDTQAAAAGAAAVYSTGAFRQVETRALIDPADQPALLTSAGAARAHFPAPNATAGGGRD